MRIYTFTLRSIKKWIFLFLMVSIFMFSLMQVIPGKSFGVFQAKKELPIYSVQTEEKKVSITFDCAWGADDISKILDTLEKEKVRATFFFVGKWAEKFPDKVKMISKSGHDIANHSYSHFRMGSLDEGKIKSEITLCSEKLKEITGREINLFRAPYGDYNNSVVKTAEKLGYYTIQWDVDSLDWKKGISKSEIFNRVTGKVTPGSIILFHNDTSYTAEVLPELITELKKKEYSIVPVSELIYKENYSIDFSGKQIRN